MKYCLPVVIICLLPIQALAEDTGTMTYGQGTKSCGKFVSDYEAHALESIRNDDWISGFLTAACSFTNTKPNIRNDIDPDARNLWVYNYCKQHPLDHLVKAVSLLAIELLNNDKSSDK